MQILFHDATTPLSYTIHTLKDRALRGTEATILRVATALSHYHEIYIAQHCRKTSDDTVINNIHYISTETAYTLSPDVVVLLRQHQLLENTANHFPNARHYLWMHNMPSRNLYQMREILLRYNYEIIAVSCFHRDAIKKRLAGKWHQRLFRKFSSNEIPIHVLYNPVDDKLQADDTPINKNQMIFTSSPYKGLPQTLKLFAAVRTQFPEYHLTIISPDTNGLIFPLPQNVTWIGSLPQHELMSYVRRSFCVFYPQTERVETFGLVYAEANAVGTPVLAHDFGAAREILSDASQLVDGHDPDAVIKKIIEWREKKPEIKAKEAFRLSCVTNAWRKLLG